MPISARAGANAKLTRELIASRSLNIPRSGIRVMFDRALGVEGLIHLEAGEPDFRTPDHIIDAAKKAMDEGYTKYTANKGCIELRRSIARKLIEENGIEADPETEIIVTVGAMQAVSLGILVTIDPGDEVIVPNPGYESFDRQVKFAGGIPVYVRLREEKDGFRMGPEDVEKAISPKTKMIVLNTPANPTGNVMSRSDIKAIAELAKLNDLLILTDEIYEKIVYDGAKHYSIASFPDMKDRCISVFGFSKTYAMTGWRIGYAVSSERIVDEMSKNQEFYVTSTSSISQKAAIAALDGPQDAVKEMVDEYKKRRDFIHPEIGKINRVGCVKPKGAFYLFPNISKLGLESREVANVLLDKGRVVTVPGTAFGTYGEGYLRLSIASSLENLRKGAESIKTVLNEL